MECLKFFFCTVPLPSIVFTSTCPEIMSSPEQKNARQEQQAVDLKYGIGISSMARV